MRSFMALLLVICSMPLFGGWENALRPNGKALDIELLNNHAPAYVILPADPKAESAAKLLQEGLLAVTGHQFPLVTAATIPANAQIIQLGGLPYNGDPEGYVLSESNGRLQFAGGPRYGLENAVMAWLEEELGLRYYAPKQPPELPGGKLSKASFTPRRGFPAMEMRWVYFKEALDPQWQLHNRVIPLKMCGGWGTHTFQWLIPNKVYFDKHPEYFSQVENKRRPGNNGDNATSGQLCLTNPNLVKELTAVALEKIAVHHGCEVLSVSMNDGYGWCGCPECKKMLKQTGSQAGALVAAVNQVARTAAQKYPKVRILTDAYLYACIPPGHQKVDLQLIVRFCFSERVKFTPHRFVDQTNAGKQFLGWSKLCPQGMYIWDYIVDFDNLMMPNPNLKVIDHNFDFYAKHGVKGALIQGNSSSAGVSQDMLKAWLAAHKLWNPKWSTDKLIQDFNYGYFGLRAGAVMQQYCTLLNSEWEKWVAKAGQNDRFHFSPDFLPQAEKLFAAAMEAADTPRYRDRIEREKLSIILMRLENGSEGSCDGMTLEQRIAAIKDGMKKYNITAFNEIHIPLSTQENRWRYVDRIKDLRNIAPSGTVYLLPATRAFLEHGAKLEQDSKSTIGVATVQEGNNSKWGVHWHLDDFPEINLNRTYKVMLLARAEKLKNTGTAVKVEWWNGRLKKLLEPAVRQNIQAEQLREDRFEWIDCGSIKPTDTGLYLLFSPLDNGILKKLHCQAVALVPASK